MTNESPEELVALVKRSFETAEETITALQLGLAAEERLDDWPLAEDRSLVRCKLLVRLGGAYADLRQGDCADNIEKAISALSEANGTPSLKDWPELWGHIQHDLGRAYFSRQRGDRADNLEQAIAFSEAALRIRTRETFPVDWAKTQNNLAAIYLSRIRGDSADNLEKTIGLFEAVSQILTHEAFPIQWAMTQHNLSVVYWKRIRGDKADNLERAIALSEEALQVRTREAFPVDWAMTQNILANAYSSRIRGDRADNLEKTIALYEEAMQVRTREAFPFHWAMTQSNLAGVYRDRIRGDRASNLERSIALQEATLEVYTREAFPIEWATSQDKLANAYKDRIRGDRASNLERSIAHYEEALRVRTREAFPYDWAITQGNLGNAYSDRIRGEKADNLERAIAFYEATLQVQTREAFPYDWAMTQNNLAMAYKDRIRGDRADNLERAIAFHEAGLQVYTREVSPEDWAAMQNNLANAYSDRIRGEKADNLEKTIALYEATLQVYTREAFPAEWAMTQNNLASTYFDRIRGEKADNLERSIALHKETLDVYTREAFPWNWAVTQYNMANAYARRVHGERTDNLERAIALQEAALEVRTRDAFPREHLRTIRLRGELLSKLKRWSEALAAFADARETFRMLLGEGLEEAEARGLIEMAGPLFACAAYAAAATGETERAFALACEGKARLMATALRLQQLDLPAGQNIRFENLRQTIREQSRLLEVTDGLDRAEVLDRLAQLRSELAGLIAIGEARTGRDDAMAQVGRICADGSVVVIPVVAEVGGKLLLAHQSTITAVDLPELTAERIKLLMRGDAESDQPGWLDSFARDMAWQERKRRMVNSVERIGAELWTLLVGPLEAALATLGVAPDARLIFMPSGGVGLLPLGLAEEPVTGRRLIETREIAYAPSLEAIDRTIPESSATPSLAAIINPTGDLIYAPIEGDLVKSSFRESTTLDASSADPAAVLASLKGKSHWHFATHGVFDLDEARRSALAMKDGAKLSVGDLLEADDLGRPRLVVLSACETGLHDIDHTPEEFVGFPGAFMTMGAQAVLGTLWPVDDCAAALLTSRFYDGHLNDDLPPASALRQAQLWLASATRQELASYAKSAAARSCLNAGALRQLQTAIEGAAAENVRFFDMPAAARLEADQPPGTERGGPARPFAHPIYWGGFVVTGQ